MEKECNKYKHYNNVESVKLICNDEEHCVRINEISKHVVKGDFIDSLKLIDIKVEDIIYLCESNLNLEIQYFDDNWNQLIVLKTYNLNFGGESYKNLFNISDEEIIPEYILDSLLNKVDKVECIQCDMKSNCICKVFKIS